MPRPRFSLSTLLVAVTVCGCVAGVAKAYPELIVVAVAILGLYVALLLPSCLCILLLELITRLWRRVKGATNHRARPH